MVCFNHKRRLIVQESGGTAKYILPVISASPDSQYPFYTSTMNVEIISGNGIYDYISGINVDDIVRLEVSDTYSEYEKDVWLTCFEGRIMSINPNFGQSNTAKLNCVGLTYPSKYVSIPEDYATASEDAGTIASQCNYFTQRIKVTVPATTFNMAYSVEQDKKFLKDVFRDIEEASGYTYFFKDVPSYDANLNLNEQVDIEFKQMSSTPVTSYAVRAGSPGLIYAHFTVTAENLFNNIYYYGATIDNAQVSGGWEDTDSEAQYDVRTYIGTDTNFNTNLICGEYSHGVLQYSKDPQITGEAILIGTSQAQICDLVPVYIPDIDINGASMDTNLRSVRVTHNMGNDEFLTGIQFGRVQKNPSDWVGEFVRKLRLNNNMAK